MTRPYRARAIELAGQFDAAKLAELRDALRPWGAYMDVSNEHWGRRAGWIAFPVDDMTDEQVIEALLAVAARSDVVA